MSSSSGDNNALCLPCPVTGGVSTKMTKASFARACKLARQAVQYSIYGRRKRNDNKILRERCAGCRGKRWPQELQITTVEDIMSQFYTCDLCGKKSSAKKPRKSLGMSLCYTCAGIVAGLQHMKELATALKKTGKTDELLKALGVEEKRYEDLEVVAMDAMEILAKALPPAPESVDDTMSAYEVATMAEEAAQHIDSLKKQITDMHDLKDVVRDAKETLVKMLPSGEALDDAQSLYDIATIAEGVALYIQEQQEKITRLSDDAGVLQSIADIIGCRTHEVLPTLRAMASYALNHRDDNNSDKEIERLRRENEYLVQQLDSRSPYDEALLEWARKRYEAGEIQVKITVVEETADENN